MLPGHRLLPPDRDPPKTETPLRQKPLPCTETPPPDKDLSPRTKTPPPDRGPLYTETLWTETIHNWHLLAATEADSTPPTGMHTCSVINSLCVCVYACACTRAAPTFLGLLSSLGSALRDWERCFALFDSASALCSYELLGASSVKTSSSSSSRESTKQIVKMV